jgi:hypothetical protein
VSKIQLHFQIHKQQHKIIYIKATVVVSKIQLHFQIHKQQHKIIYIKARQQHKIIYIKATMVSVRPSCRARVMVSVRLSCRAGAGQGRAARHFQLR